MPYNIKRKAVRAAMAAELAETARRHGGAATVEPAPLNDRALWVRIASGGAHVTISIDGNSTLGFLTPWNVDSGCEGRFSSTFGCAVGASVNAFHRRKCMGYAPDWPILLRGIVDALDCIAAGEAFMAEESSPCA